MGYMAWCYCIIDKKKIKFNFQNPLSNDIETLYVLFAHITSAPLKCILGNVFQKPIK